MEYKDIELERLLKDAEFRGKMIEVMQNLNKNQDELKDSIDAINCRLRDAEGNIKELKARQKILWAILSIILSVIIGIWIYNIFIP